MNVTVPANTTATIYVPAENKEQVMESGMLAVQNPDLTFIKMENGKAVFEVGSGQYELTTTLRKQYILNVVNDNESQKSLVSINGKEPQKLPIIENVYEGDEVTLSAKPENDVDYKFERWYGDNIEEKANEITLQVGGDIKLAIENSFIERENLALSKMADASTTISNADWGLKNINDGQLLSVKGNLGFTTNGSSEADVEHWLEIDLGEDMDFNRIQLYPRTDVFTKDGKTPSFPKDFSIQICKNGESTYTTAANYTDYEAPEGKPAVLKWKNPVLARKVRINVTKVGNPPAGEIHYLQFAEMGIYKEEVVRTEQLEKEIEKAVSYEGREGDYTDTSWKLFYDALQNAKELIKNEHASQQEIDAAQGTRAVITGLAPNTAYTFTVYACDKAGNISKGAEVSFKTLNKIQTTAVTSVKLNYSKLTLNGKSEKQLRADIVPGNASNKKVSWKSSDKTVVSVDTKGRVTAKKPGKAAITVTTEDGKKTAVCSINVKSVKAKSISLSAKKKTLYKGKTFQLKSTVKPSNTTDHVLWSSSDKKVAAVSSKGIVTAKKAGKATITAKTSSKKQITCVITVKEVKASGVKLNLSKRTLKAGKALYLKATIKPRNSTDTIQ